MVGAKVNKPRAVLGILTFMTFLWSLALLYISSFSRQSNVNQKVHEYNFLLSQYSIQQVATSRCSNRTCEHSFYYQNTDKEPEKNLKADLSLSIPNNQTPKLFTEKVVNKEQRTILSSPDTGRQAWQYIDGGLGAVFSAFLDHRKNFNEVIVVAMSQYHKRKSQRPSLWCHLVYNDSTSENVKATVHLLNEVVGKKYAVYFLICNLKAKAPVYISITGVVNQTEFSNRLRVNVYEDGPKSQIGVCIPAFYSNFNEAVQLIEAFEVYRLFGAERITIYNGSHSSEVDCVLRTYQADGFLEVVQFDINAKGYRSNSSFLNPDGEPWDVQSNAQVAQVNDCLFRSMNKLNYVAFMDIDEILLPRRYANWITLLEAYVKNNTNSASFLFRNFFAYMAGSPASLQAQLKRPVNVSDALFFTQRVRRKSTYKPIPWPTYRTKYIVKPNDVSHVGIHQAYLVAGKLELFIDTKDGLLLHFRQGFADSKPAVQTVEEDTMLQHREPIRAAVEAKLHRLKKACKNIR